MEVRLPKLTGYQQEVMDWFGNDYKGSGKTAVIKSVRQSGKSFFAMMMLTKVALESTTVSIMFSPTMDQARVFFKSIADALSPLGVVKNKNSQTNIIELTNGSQLIFRSTTLENSNRGYTVTGLLVLDECAYLSDESIFTALPLINAHNAPMLICSTPFVRQGYYYDTFKLGLSGENPNIKSFDWSKNKEVERFLTPERKAFYKTIMSRSKYTTEVEGEFLSDEGLLFQNIDRCINDKPEKSEVSYIGIDFGTGSEGDYTVMSVFNQKGQMTELHRTNNLTPMQQVDWLAAHIQDTHSRGKVLRILAEINSIGKVYVDALNAKLPPNVMITDWVTSNSSKQELVTSFQIALENEYVSILRNEQLITELQSYSQEINPKTKVITYNGKNCHDDCVIAAMLGYMAYKNVNSTGTYTISNIRHTSTARKRGRDIYG